VCDRVKKLTEEFSRLSEDEKVEFCMSVMPLMCETFSKNQDKMLSVMKNMIPHCMEIMQKSGMNINMMKMMEMMQHFRKNGYETDSGS